MSPAPASTAEAGDERLPLAESAYRILKRRILDNELPPGTIMLELEVANMLNMSRTPAREAMVRLADEGLVDMRPRHGMRVLPILAGDMREIYSVLTALESEAAEWVAREGVSEARLQALHDAVAAMDESLARDDLMAWAASDERFHRTLVESCGNARLRSLIFQFWDQSHRGRMATLRLRPKPVDSNRDHLALVEAIANSEPERARTIHREHRRRHGEMLANLLESPR
jgi:DNA-binding GntR family transcriptional regulator